MARSGSCSLEHPDMSYRLQACRALAELRLGLGAMAAAQMFRQVFFHLQLEVEVKSVDLAPGRDLPQRLTDMWPYASYFSL